MLGLHCCVGFSLVRACGGYALVALHGLLIAVASLIEEHGALGMRASVVAAHALSCCSSRALEHRLIVVEHRLSCCAAYGIFLDQGLNLYLLHWPVDSLPLSHQGSPFAIL